MAIFSHIFVPESLSRSSIHFISLRDIPHLSTHVPLVPLEKRLPSVNCMPQGRKPAAGLRKGLCSRHWSVPAGSPEILLLQDTWTVSRKTYAPLTQEKTPRVTDLETDGPYVHEWKQICLKCNQRKKTSFLKKLIIANSTANHDHSKHCVSVKTSNQEEHYIFRLHFKDVK